MESVILSWPWTYSYPFDTALWGEGTFSVPARYLGYGQGDGGCVLAMNATCIGLNYGTARIHGAPPNHGLFQTLLAGPMGSFGTFWGLIDNNGSSITARVLLYEDPGGFGTLASSLPSTPEYDINMAWSAPGGGGAFQLYTTVGTLAPEHAGLYNNISLPFYPQIAYIKSWDGINSHIYLDARWMVDEDVEDVYNWRITTASKRYLLDGANAPYSVSITTERGVQNHNMLSTLQASPITTRNTMARLEWRMASDYVGSMLEDIEENGELEVSRPFISGAARLILKTTKSSVSRTINQTTGLTDYILIGYGVVVPG